MSIRRKTERRTVLADDYGLRFNKPFSRTDAQFRPTSATEYLTQTDSGFAEYTVTVRGPVQNKNGTDSERSHGEVTYGTGYGKTPIADLPRQIASQLIGPVGLSKAIALPAGGAK